MRDDMSRVITTHPRHGDKWSKRRRSLRKRQDWEEEAPQRERMRPTSNEVGGYDDAKFYNLGEYLTPLKRYIESKVGCHWDRVYSEIRANIDPNNAVQAHILQHIFGYIEVKCYWKDGVLWSSNYYGGSRSYNPGLVGPGNLYVCPTTGIINKMKGEAKSQRRTKRVDPNKLENNGKNYQKIEGLWYEIISTYQEQRGPRWVVKRPYNKPNHPGTRTLETYWPREIIQITKKRQLNSKELRRLELKNG